jgi:NAD(P)H-hydrate repair Nnr-like enzyme with NAD(P)H-hydrate dehydratase domain
VLAGYLAGLLAQPGLQINPQKTLAWGVWQHGAAADELQEEQPNWVVEDLAARIGSACKAIRVNGSGCWT